MIERETKRNAKREWVAPVAAALVALVVGVAAIDALPVGVFYDDAMYVILAKSLATGQGLRWLNIPGAPPATHFPPGYPAVLAVLWKLYPQFPANVILFKIANACFLAAVAAGVAVFARRRLGFSRAGAAAASVAATVAAPMLMLSAQVMSEPLFLALVFPTLLFAERVADDDKRLTSVVGLGLVVGLVMLVRSQGVAILGAVGLVLVLRRRFRDALTVAAAAVVVVLPWQLWVRANVRFVPGAMGGNYQPYTTWLIDGFRESGVAVVGRTVVHTAADIANMLAVFAAPSASHGVQLAAIAAVLLLCVLGIRRLGHAAPVTAGFLALYVAMILVWPFSPTRFVLGIWPFVVLVPMLGALEAARWRAAAGATRTLRLVAVGCTCLIGVGYVRYTARAYRGRWWSSMARSNASAARPLVQWVAAHTPASAVISSEVEPMTYLYTNRHAVPVSRFTTRDYFRSPTSAESADVLRGILSTYPVTAVAVLAPGSLWTALQTMSSGAAPELVLRDSLSNGLIYAPLHQ